MISESVEIVDLDPLQWRRYGQMLVALRGDPKTLIIVHRNGTYLGCDDPLDKLGGRAVRIGDARRTLASLRRRFRAYDRICILDERALEGHSRAVQEHGYKNLDVDQYLRLCKEATGQFADGLVADPPLSADPLRFSPKEIEEFVRRIGDGVIVVAVMEKGALYFSLIVRIAKKRVNLVTTFDCFSVEGLDMDATAVNLASVQGRVARRFGAVSVGLEIEHGVLLKVYGAADRLAELKRHRDKMVTTNTDEEVLNALGLITMLIPSASPSFRFF